MAKTQIKDVRTYTERDSKTHEKVATKLNYTVHLENGKVVDVINEFGYSVEPKSEVMQYYTRKFGK